MLMIKDIIVLLINVVFVICASENVTGAAQNFYLMATYRENMKDNSKSYVEYTCTAEMDYFNRLSWYKIKGTKHMLLNMIQQQDNIHTVNKTLTLHMTLEDTDKSSEIYCLKENRTIQRKYYKEIIRWIQLSFNRTVLPLEKGHANIEPYSKIVYFDTETIMRFVCRGTTPTDGRTLTWYLENYDHSEQPSDEISITPQFELAGLKNKKYDLQKNETVLELQLKKSYHLKRLFCAQDKHVQVIEDNGVYAVVRYAQRVRSSTITLILRDSVGLMSEPGRHEPDAFNGGEHKETIHRNANDVSEPGRHEPDAFNGGEHKETKHRNANDGPWWSVAFVTSLALILLIALVVIIKKWKKTKAEFEEKERQWNRLPLLVPNENHYDTVYSHGAGLLRRPIK